MPDLPAEVTGWIGGQADYWKRRARQAEATVEQVRNAHTRCFSCALCLGCEIATALHTPDTEDTP